MKKQRIRKGRKKPAKEAAEPAVDIGCKVPEGPPLKFQSEIPHTPTAAENPDEAVLVSTTGGLEAVSLEDLFNSIGDKPVEKDVNVEALAEIINQAAADNQPGLTTRPKVRWLPPNPRLVIAQVGEHMHVRIMVRPNNKHYLPGMEIPMNISMVDFNPNELLIFNGDPPRRKGVW